MSQRRLTRSRRKGKTTVSDILQPTAATAALSEAEWLRILKSISKFIDTPSLKELRLVSKTWNAAACTLIPERTVVDLEQKTEEQIQEFAFVLQTVHQNERPSPFKNYYIRVKMTHDSFLQVILKDSRTYIVRLDYGFERNLKHDSTFPNYLYEVLQQSSSTLEYLKFGMQVHGSAPKNKLHNKQSSSSSISSCSSSHWELNIGNFPIGTSQEQLQLFPLYLPQLTDFEFWNLYPGTTNIPFSFFLFPCQILLGATNLQRFYASSADSKLLNRIFSQSLLKNVPDVHITDFKTACSRSLAGTRFNGIKSLGLQRFTSVANQQGLTFGLLKDIILKVRSTLEELALSGVNHISDELWPSDGCPRLRALLLDDWFGDMNVFSYDRAPELNVIAISNYHGSVPHFSRTTAKPHPEVVQVTFKGHLELGNKISKEIQHEYCRLFLYIRHQFPNVTRFHLKMAELTIPVVRGAFEALPWIEELLISSSVGTAKGFTENIILGISENSLRHHLSSKTYANRHSQRRNCILDLANLKTLKIRLFDKRDHISLTAIRYGIAKLSNLKEFSFNCNWHTLRDLKTIHELLSHLSNITIYYSGKDFWYGKYWTDLNELVASIAEDQPIPPITIVSDQDDEQLRIYRNKLDTCNYQFISYVPNNGGTFMT